MTKTEQLDKLARDGEERLLLARALDKLETARRKNIPAATGFLSPSERVSVENLIAANGHPPHLFFGGYPGRSGPSVSSSPTGRSRRMPWPWPWRMRGR